MVRIRSTYLVVSGSLFLTSLLLWFAVANYRSAQPVAESILRGLSLSLGQAIESVAARDATFKSLSDFTSTDIAYFSILDSSGRIRFHSNTNLIGEQIQDQRYQAVTTAPVATEQRVRLGTGEVIFETQQQLHLPDGKMILRLALHTWQSDQIIRRARSGVLVIILLLVTGWGIGLFALQLQRRDLLRRDELARHEQLARLGELGAVMAHEVRTPLAGIKGYAQLLEEQLDDPRQHSRASMIVAESERLERLVSDLLTYVRQEPVSDGSADAAQVIEQAWQSLAAAAEKSGVSLQVTGVTRTLIACPADRLLQLLLNIFQNGIQAMPLGGSLRVTLSSANQQALFLIADDGSGFAKESLQRAFDPFYTTRASGSGLGLAVCRTIAEAYGGKITVTNGRTGGGEILLQLPLVKEHYE